MLVVRMFVKFVAYKDLFSNMHVLNFRNGPNFVTNE